MLLFLNYLFYFKILNNKTLLMNQKKSHFVCFEIDLFSIIDIGRLNDDVNMIVVSRLKSSNKTTVFFKTTFDTLFK